MLKVWKPYQARLNMHVALAHDPAHPWLLPHAYLGLRLRSHRRQNHMWVLTLSRYRGDTFVSGKQSLSILTTFLIND